MSAMVRTLLGLLCLLLAPAGASEEGEVCLGWVPIPVEGFQPFHCPQRLDGKDGRFCCGTCIAPYCCDSEEARLDQDQCLYVWKILQFLVPALMVQRERASLPAFQDLETTPTSQPKIRKVRSSAGETTPAPSGQPRNDKERLIEILIVVFSFVVMCVVVLIELIWKCCPERCPPCLRPRQHGAPLYFPMGAIRGPLPPDSSPPVEVFDPPPPYEERPLLPPYSQEDPSNRSRGEDEAQAGPLRPAHTVPGSEEAVTQAPMASAATSATGEPAAAGEVTLASGAAVKGKVTPESEAGALQEAAGGGKPEWESAGLSEVTPVQEAAGGGKATAGWDAAGGGEGATPPVSPAPGETSTQPAPVEKTIHGSSGVSCEIKESKV